MVISFKPTGQPVVLSKASIMISSRPPRLILIYTFFTLCMSLSFCTHIVTAQTAGRPVTALTSYWEQADQRQVFVVRGRQYQLRIATQPAQVIDLLIDGQPVLGKGGITFAIRDAGGKRYVPAPAGMIPKWQVHTGQQPKPATSSAARMNVWRASPMYWEIQLLDIPFVPQTAASAEAAGEPMRGRITLHAFPDRVHLVISVAPTNDQQPQTVELFADVGESRIEALDNRTLTRSGGVCILAGDNGTMDENAKRWQAPIDAQTPAWWVIRPDTDLQPAQVLFAEELHPLSAQSVQVTGGIWRGYDPVAGLYRISTDALRGAFAFEPAYKIPTRRITTTLKVEPDQQPRNITVACATGLGNLEAGVIADAHGFPLPIPTFVTKNFAGENEEADDTAYGDLFFPLQLEPGQRRDLQIIPLFQNWGNHALKQVSSIRFFNIYWHLSTGLSETTCFTHAFMKMRGTYVQIPDFRPYSGPFMMGQPQHECYTWPGLLQYQTASGDVRLLYRDTVFDSIAPNLARFTMNFVTSDDAARAAVTVMEIPQTDEMRTFLHLRYEWDKPVEIAGDARETFRWLNIFEKNLPRQLIWLDADEQPQAETIHPADAPMKLAMPLSARGAFAGIHEQKDAYSSMLLVRSLKGRLGGKEIDAPFLSARFDPAGGSYWLTDSRQKLQLQAGDYIEADVMLMPHATVTTALFKPKRERRHWVEQPPTIGKVEIGKKISDFPATVRAADDVARFSVKGGLDTVPIIIEGFSRPVLPMLWRADAWQDQQVHGGDGYQVDTDNDGNNRFTFVYPIRGTEELHFTVSLMKCSQPIVSIRGENGYARIDAEAEADFSTSSPACFSPGINTRSPGNPLTRFSGRSSSIVQIPLEFQANAPDASVEVIEFSPRRIELITSGDFKKLSIPHRPDGVGYQVQIDGSPVGGRQRQVLRIDPPAGRHRIVAEIAEK